MAGDAFAPLGAAPSPAPARDEWRAVLPAPHPLPATLRHPGHGTPAAVWEYRDAAGALLFVVARFDTPEGKEVMPYCCDAKGWRWKAPPAPRPLYGLDALAARPAGRVLLVEGEKAADAAARTFPEHVAVTWPGGSNALGKVDWTPLRGRHVSLWPDNDTAGRKAMADAATALRVIGAASLALVHVPSEWPEGWDLADPTPEGTAPEALAAMLAGAAAPKPAMAPRDSAMPPPFVLRADGVWWMPKQDEESRHRPTPVHVCGPLRVVARTHDGTGHAWGALLEWQDADGRRHEWAMPSAMLAGEATEVQSHLLGRGLFVGTSSKAREKLAEYLTRATPAERVRVVSRIGWHGAPGARCFVLPDAALGSTGQGRTMLQTERPDALPPLFQAGTLDEWKAEVAALAVGNARLGFALCASVAAPLLALVGAEGGGFHFRGGSSLGKSTALYAAGSVWGGGPMKGWMRSWRTTDNALEAVAAAHCDLPLLLDEMGEASPETVAACAYALANGAGKGRAARDGSARRVAEWRCLFLSTGEEGLADRLAEARGGPKRVRAGQEVRVLDIPAEAGPLGMFECLHGLPSAGALADAIKARAARFYGTAGRAWLAVLAEQPEAMAQAAREVIAAFEAHHVSAGATGQVRRAAARFALAAAAGELATGAGLLPWPPGEAERAAAACFAAWRGNRAAGDGAAEDAAAVAAVAAFIGAHGESRFQTVGEWRPSEGAAEAVEPETRVVVNRAGWRKRAGEGWRYCILPETWRREVVAGMDPVLAAKAVQAAGHLDTERKGRLTRNERVGATNPARVYVVLDTILTDQGGG